MELSVKERDYLNNLINLFNIEPEYIEKIIYYDADLGYEVGYIETVYPIMDKELTNRYLSTTSPLFKADKLFTEMEDGKEYKVNTLLGAKCPIYYEDVEMGALRETRWECPNCENELGDFIENDWEYSPYCGQKLKMLPKKDKEEY